MEPLSTTSLFQQALAKQAQSVSNTPHLAQAIEKAAKGNETAGSQFSAILQNTIDKSIDSQYKAEDLSRKSLTGDVSLTELVPALLNAETTLNTVVTIRDRVVEAYREILRTPI